MVVDATDIVPVNVRQLALDGIMRPAMLIEHRAELVAESVAARQSLITYLADHKQNSCIADRLRFIVATGKHEG